MTEAEWNSGTVEYLKPQPKFVGGVTELPAVAPAGGGSMWVWAVVLGVAALAGLPLVLRRRI